MLVESWLELVDRLGHSKPQAALIHQHAGVDRQTELARRFFEMALSKLSYSTTSKPK